MANELTEKQKKFCEEYLIDFNGARAYKACYSTCKKDETAYTNSSRMLRNAKVQAYIKERTKKSQEQMQITQDMIKKELANIAFFDIRKIYNDDGSLKNIKDIDTDTAKAISSIETFQEFEGYEDDREYIGSTKKIKTYDKKGALELLGKHLGMFKDKIEIDTDKPFEVNINIVKK